MSKVFTTEHTKVLNEVIREIEIDPTKIKGAAYMPSVEFTATTVFWDVWEAQGGATQDHVMGTDPKAVQKGGFRTLEYEGGSYREFIRFTEKDILRLRQLGSNDQAVRGIRQHLNRAGVKLNNRIEAKMELLRWDAILNGSYTYFGKTIDFGKPVNHDVAPGVPWGLIVGGNLVTNPAANPIADLRFWLMGGYAPFRKYVVSKMVINANTSRIILDNPNVQSLIQSRFASESYDKVHDINAVLSFLIPGMPPVEVYKGWYQSEAPDPGNAARIIVGDAIYFIPDGRAFFEVELPDGDKIGDVAMTLNLSNGSVDSPAAGKFILVDEHIEDRPGNPYIDIYGGFVGGPRLKRPADVLTATLI